MKRVMVFGTFDILHLGHIALFEQAKTYGDELIVVVARSSRSAGIKKQLPLHTAQERLELIEHIDLVDRAVIGDETDVYKVLNDWRPDVIALGYDQSAFVDGIEKKLQEFDLEATVVRLEARAPEKHKSGLIRRSMEPSV